MPLRRSPPLQTHISAPASDCESHVSDTNDTVRMDKASQRQKRKRTNTSDSQLMNFMTEMKGLFSEFKAQQDDKLDKICSVIEEIKTQNSEIRSSMEFLSNKYDSMLDQLNTLRQETANNKVYIESLENKIEKYERSSRSTCVEIRNIPVIKSETKPTLLKTLTEIGNIINVSIQPLEVKDVFRINNKNHETKTIIVEFTNVFTRDRILNGYKNFNKSNGRLNTEHLKFSGTTKPIFISENLTAKMKRLFYLTRVFASSNEYKYCWTANGKIVIREKEGSTLHWIKDESDLQKLGRQK
ncbi:unnamed protein product [Diatraea saccharalis]|uniref:FP protein C-terminal domain-containing protein n=1 Tax=Diatraea saccharalis TaxID=40085 RepID=A0A9N9QYP3_9NEOP|nr:unnamed protein product [Diatraea saccharalis]